MCHIILNKIKLDIPIGVAVPKSDLTIFKNHLKEFKNIFIISGEENNLASRFLVAMKEMDLDYIYRVTADSPYLVKDVFELLNDNDQKFLTYGAISLYGQKKLAHGTVVSLLSKNFLTLINSSNCDIAKEHLVLSNLKKISDLIFHPVIPKELHGENYRFSCDTIDDYRFLLNNNKLDINVIDAKSTMGHFSKRVIYDQY